MIIPTFNEFENVGLITTKIRESLSVSEKTFEIWFIDDSTDNTQKRLDELSKTYTEVHYIHRDCKSGLATAVVEGFSHSSGTYIVVMDADLQHPPELLPKILETLDKGTEVVIPSRFIDGGSDGGLNNLRKLVSWTARVIGRLTIQRLRNISDCTGGYFGINRKVIEGVTLDPIGWKILMEVLVQGNYSTVHEVPYKFVQRSVGESKMSLQEQWNYLRHVVRMVRRSPEDRRFLMFCLVGATGVLVNLIVLAILLRLFHHHYAASSVGASLIAMGSNFFWNDRFTWKGYTHNTMWRRILKFPTFVAISALGIGVTGLFAQIAVWLHWNELVGQFVGIIVATAWSYWANNRFTWSGNEGKLKKIIVTRNASST